MPVKNVIQVRRDTAANWTSTNPTLSAGEIGFETDTNRFKIGTGSTAWNSLSYAANKLNSSYTFADYGTTTVSLASGWYGVGSNFNARVAGVPLQQMIVEDNVSVKNIYELKKYSTTITEISVRKVDNLTPVTPTSAIFPTDSTATFGAITFGLSTYVAVSSSNGGLISTSTDLITWTSRTSNSTTNLNAATFGSVFVVGGNNGNLRSSTDGITWNTRTSGFGTSNINALTFGSSTYVAVGAGGTITTSTDAITWTTRTSGTTQAIQSVIFANSLFLYGGSSGVLRTSTDAVTWTARTSQFGTSAIYNITYSNGIYVAVGGAGKISTSTDGITWTSRTSGFGNGSVDIRSIASGDGHFLIVGDDLLISTSTDGITWYDSKSPYSNIGNGTNSFRIATYLNNVFIVGGARSSETLGGGTSDNSETALLTTSTFPADGVLVTVEPKS